MLLLPRIPKGTVRVFFNAITKPILLHMLRMHTKAKNRNHVLADCRISQPIASKRSL